MADFTGKVCLLVLIKLTLFLIICLEMWNSSKARWKKVMKKASEEVSATVGRYTPTTVMMGSISWLQMWYIV